MFTAATALRLARFNTQPHDTDKRYFQGLPCTAAAPVIAGMVWLGSLYDMKGMVVAIFVAIVTLTLAACMVSHIRYYSFKKIDLRGKVSFFAVVLFVLIIAAVSMAPAIVLFSLFFSFALSGPVMTLWQLRRIRRRKQLSMRH